MSTKPTTKPRWALTAGGADAANIATPSPGEQDIGYTNGQNPVSSGKTNWLFNAIAKWINFLDDSPNFAPTTANAPGLKGTGASTNGDGVQGQGTGAGKGGNFTGGATGPGVVGAGGATSGDGFQGTGTGGGNGVTGTGQGAGKGVQGTGGATGVGIAGIGGATSGDGVTGSGTAGNSRGGNFTGQGSAEGALVAGGATGPGLKATAGGGTPARGAISLSSQATPTAPSDGDVWYDGSAATPRLAARMNGVNSNTPVAVAPSANWTVPGQLTYMRSPDGIVRIRGYAQAGAGAAWPIFTLPVGYRPGPFARRFGGADSTGVFFDVIVNGNGDITATAAPVNGRLYFFDCVHFLSET